MKEVNKIVQVILGTSLIALAIGLLITAHRGYDTVSTFLIGVLTIVPIPFWVASLLFNSMILLIVFIVDKKELGIGSFINGIGLGLLIGIFEPVLDSISVSIPFYSEVSIILAPILFGLGAGIYVASDKGSGAMEALTALIYKRSQFSMKTIRMMLDAFFVLIGFSLGATIGLGTFLCVLFVGPVFEYTYKAFERNN
ncbi:YczE/YyaS/YitT family protein [Carnobacterium maltaromaticum]|uniref:YczE/YyaS/YitT family protein n=1 Tax=Carnobacterium maltaromaticum TaxID=2751 RepID=UPI00191BB4EB|nr:YitT family protein [Carnobacterium maltaromaticum]CAD5901649.1 conserved membrane hypothetical protein [Carnobacterium maltaromaticum]